MLGKIRKTKEAMGVAKDFRKVLCSACRRRVMKKIKQGDYQNAMSDDNLCESCRDKLQKKAQDRGKDNLEGMLG